MTVFKKDSVVLLSRIYTRTLDSLILNPPNISSGYSTMYLSTKRQYSQTTKIILNRQLMRKLFRGLDLRADYLLR